MPHSGISVVIPTYNRAGRLPYAIESVLRQGCADIEIVVVDDGSTDDTRSVVERFGDRIRYVYQSNAGAGAARNTGIRHATREFVAFLDSDDRWYDYKLSMQLALLRARPDVGLVFSDFVIERHDRTMLPGGASIWAGRILDFPAMQRIEIRRTDASAPDWPAERVECWVGDMYRQLLDELPILTSSVVVRRTALDSTTWYKEGVALFEDWEFFARIAQRSAVGYVSVPSAVNVGHLDPGRVSKCDAIDRAESYRTLLERVWLADQQFVSAHTEAATAARGRSLLAVAREAILSGRPERAREALAEWRTIGSAQHRLRAAVYEACAGVAGGATLLRNFLRARLLLGMLAGSGRPRHGAVHQGP